VVVAKPSLSSVQSIVGLVAGLTSIAGGVYSAVHYVGPEREVGEVVAVVRAAQTGEPVRDAAVEVLTREDALVTTLTPTEDGAVRRALEPGQYRLRVSHPRFGTETRAIEVRPGETAEVRLQLVRLAAVEPRGEASRTQHGKQSTPVDTAAHAVTEGVNATRRFLGRLGL
jgi:hypothetical protein